ncbi:MAG: hypothetical protein MOGMAGMI_01603 [Candidatus Omnitrophica bacterium]|nr:hypothetical protein [Candidatus Omnitrophota bacterium]
MARPFKMLFVPALVLLLAATLAGCGSPKFLRDVKKGMNRDQVLNLLGKPDAMYPLKNGEFFIYESKDPADQKKSKKDRTFIVEFKNGAVEDTGTAADFQQLVDE